MPRQNKFPVSSFDPSLLAALLSGALNREVYSCNSVKQASRLVFRLNALRQAMKRENHEAVNQVYRCNIRQLKDPEGKMTNEVELAPKDEDLKNVLSTVGLPLALPPEPSLPPNSSNRKPWEIDVDD